jgi:hypothetical protein
VGVEARRPWFASASGHGGRRELGSEDVVGVRGGGGARACSECNKRGGRTELDDAMVGLLVNEHIVG